MVLDEAPFTAGLIPVEVAYSPQAGIVWRRTLMVVQGCSIGEALQASEVLLLHAELDLTTLKLGVWGHARTIDECVRAADRIEIYRPLRVDPKEARRQRYQTHRKARPVAPKEPRRSQQLKR